MSCRALGHRLLVRLRLSEHHQLNDVGVKGGLPEVQVLVYLHLLPDTPSPVPSLSSWHLADVPQDARGLGHGEVSIHQHRQLLEGQLRSLPVLSSEQLEGDLLVRNPGAVEEKQRSSGGVRYSVAE